MDASHNPYPVKLTQDRPNKFLRILWSDGLDARYPWIFLRENCPSAGEKVLREEKQQNPLGIMKSVPSSEIADTKMVGTYAVSFSWTDGHSAGIYTWEYLRKLAENPRVLQTKGEQALPTPGTI